MQWANVKLVLAREIRDQLRDRRTMFMIVVLPLLLYPLLGMSFFQISQFIHAQPTRVKVIGAKAITESTDGLPPLFENNRFASRLFPEQSDARLLELQFARTEPSEYPADIAGVRSKVRGEIRKDAFEAALYFPPDFTERLRQFREWIQRSSERAHSQGDAADAPPPFALAVPMPEIIPTSSDDSQITAYRLKTVLDRWAAQIGESNLEAAGVPAEAARPFDVVLSVPSEDEGFQADDFWSKVPPVMLLLWALTGAFYPAVDLCAGEKERGTLETLLCSPALRSELVLGKLGTVMLFSMATAVLNLVSVGITGFLVLSQIKHIGPPPAMAVVWLTLALVPVSALFSALCLALASFARSTKEGQYYLMPLLLVTMPLAVLPMAPGVELTLGNSIIPVTGLVLLLRSLLAGQYALAAQFAPPVLAVTLGSCVLAIRWAVDQFNSESVLFRESERFSIGTWLRHLLRDREPTPTAALAIFCGLLILVVRFFLSLTMRQPSGPNGFLISGVATQLAVILTPALLMAVMLTTNPCRSLRLRRPVFLDLAIIPMAGLLAVAIHPVAIAVQAGIQHLYPVSPEVAQALQGIFNPPPNFWLMLAVFAALPALCEELAFRGFILTGFEQEGRTWRAIVGSAFFFGLAHAILQQSINAFLVGIVIGYIAVRTGNILPGMLFHLVNNAITLSLPQLPKAGIQQIPVLGDLVTVTPDGGFSYAWPVVVVGGMLSVLLLLWFGRLRLPGGDASSPLRRTDDWSHPDDASERAASA